MSYTIQEKKKREAVNAQKHQTIREYAQHWKKVHAPYIKLSTQATYLSILENHILPYFGNMTLQSITFDMNQAFILYLCREGRLDGTGGLSVKMAKDIMSVWISILKFAEEEKLIKMQSHHYRYPQKEVSINTTKKNKILNIKQEISLIDFLQSNPTSQNLGILLALSTGMRIGEICALRWENIDLEYQVVHVKETLQRIYWKQSDTEKLQKTDKAASEIIVTKPKSVKSIRTIPLAEYLINLLRPLRKSQDTFFLTGRIDKHMEPRTYRDYYTRLLSKNNLLFVNFHGLRHTFATRCIEAGCDYKTVSELLGHANVETTLRLYVHSNMERKRNCIEAMHTLCKKEM